jgi:PAS domain S-box-containing protein
MSKTAFISKNPDFLSDGGTMGALIRAHDWQRTSLGAPEHWPVGLRIALRIMLTTQHPVFVFWGPEHISFYNDAYSRSLGPEKHPAILGQRAVEAWPEIWPIIGPQIDQVMRGDGATWHENALVPIIRHGALQQVFWTYSYSPIDDPTAPKGVGGVLVICTETTERILSERRLELERNRLEQLFAQAPTFMTVLSGPQHHFELVNPEYLRIIGHRPVIGRPLAEALPDAAAQGYLQLLDQVYRSGEAFIATGARYEMQKEPGGPVSDTYVDFAYQPIKDADGKVWGIFVIGSDVTDRILAENRRNALARLTDEFRYQKSGQDIAYQAARILGETLGASRVGYGTVDVATSTLQVDRDWTAPGVPSLAGPRALHNYSWLIHDLILGNDVVVNDVETDARTAKSAKGLQQRAAAAFVNMPVIEDNQLVSMLYVNDASARTWSAEELAFIKEVAERTRTVSERLRNESALRESEARFRTITEAMPQMVWSTLPDGSHDYFNSQWYEFTGVPAGATDGDRWREVFHADDQQSTLQKWHHSLETGEPYEVQYRLRHHSGEYRWTLGRALPIRDQAGKIVRWMGTCTDIHDQKLAEVELRESSLRKDEFLAMLAHELRNPLAPISSAAMLLRTKNPNENRILHASDIISRQVRHMTSLVDDLLDVSRVSRGLVELEMENVDVREIVNHAIEQARPLIEQRKQFLQFRMGVAAVFVRGDRTRLVQVIANLLNNAAKYTPQGGEIVVSVGVEAGRVDICVRDNGSGISPALLPYVFDLFTQGERSPDRAQGGLGLGLALVKGITSKHGGEVLAQSEGAGRGSSFTISLPVVEVQQLQASQLAQDAVSQGALRLMIVDDNADAAATLAALLELDGHRVTVAEDAVGALEAVKEAVPQVFILDIGLPDMDGYELARRLRASAATANALIVALSGYGQEHDRVLSRAAGFDHHFVKPLNIELLKSMFLTVSSASPCLQSSK